MQARARRVSTRSRRIPRTRIATAKAMLLSSFFLPMMLALLAPGTLDGSRGTGVVSAETIDVASEPDEGAFVTGKLKRGDPVTIVSRLESGWLAIEPPEGSFSWVDHDAIEELGGGRARVVAARAGVRPGRAGARMPGAAKWILPAGSAITLVDRPALTLRQGGRVRTWEAIVPPAGELRYVMADGVNFSAVATNDLGAG